jgi:hypothetical protein
MTAEENKAIVRRLIEDLWNAGNPESPWIRATCLQVREARSQALVNSKARSRMLVL